MNTKVKTDFLFVRPSFLAGMARVLDLYGQYDIYNVSPTTSEADAKAIASDWIVVGQDIGDAMEMEDCEKRCTA